jgi:hypothetical protein
MFESFLAWRRPFGVHGENDRHGKRHSLAGAEAGAGQQSQGGAVALSL